MTDEILKFTKLSLLVTFIISLVTGVMFWFPAFSASLFGFPNTPQINMLFTLVGSAHIGLGIGSLLGYLAKAWNQVKIYVIVEIIYTIGGEFIGFINFSLFNAILAIILQAIILVLLLLSFLQQQDVIKPLIK